MCRGGVCVCEGEVDAPGSCAGWDGKTSPAVHTLGPLSPKWAIVGPPGVRNNVTDPPMIKLSACGWLEEAEENPRPHLGHPVGPNTSAVSHIVGFPLPSNLGGRKTQLLSSQGAPFPWGSIALRI